MKLFFKIHLLLALTVAFTGCSSGVSNKIEKIQSKSTEQPSQKLVLLDQLYDSLDKDEDKLKVLKSIETLLREEIKDPNLLLQIYKKQAFFSGTDTDRNLVFLKIAQLSVQNLKDNVIAQNYLFKIKEDLLDKEQRDQFYQLKVLSFINSGQFKQADVEVNDLLKRKDLSPTERFKINMLRTRILSAKKKNSEVEKVLLDLLRTHPNLSMKWRLRSQLSVLYEDKEDFKKAIEQLKKMKEEQGEDELLLARIKQLEKRSKQQPGGKGWLRR
jgi:outer membrane PBP1 activator LpoA protein